MSVYRQQGDIALPRQTTLREDTRVQSATAPRVDFTQRPAPAHKQTPATGGGAWLRRYGMVAEIALSLGAGVGVALIAHGAAATVAALAALAVWVVAAYHKGRTNTSPLPRQLRLVVQSIVITLAVVALTAAILPRVGDQLPAVTVAVLAAGLVAAVCRAVRWRLQTPVRIMVVGDQLSIASAIARFGTSDRLGVVAAIVVEPDLDEAPKTIMGVPVATSLAAASGMVAAARVDLVIATPGPSFTSVDLRRLAWSLESTEANLGVMGVLDSVAPHRITPGVLHGATINDVRVPRPSWVVRVTKAALDRTAAAVLLVLLAPVLGVIALAIRLDSKGPAFFTQTRIGLRGKPFRVYKLRTMVQDAEQLKAELAGDNEYDGVLFKMKRDPRITRVGALLRKSSLDELPQLINVARGEMSLVGPRPSLPAEVELMDSDTLRRLAVKPGITGLWQVSGRSDLSWDQASLLDTYYTDNWSLSGDLSICVRTVRAVAKGDGAY